MKALVALSDLFFPPKEGERNEPQRAAIGAVIILFLLGGVVLAV